MIIAKYQIINSRSGYTLVELLAVTGLIVVISGIIVGVMYSTLRGGNKTKVTNDVTQNANFALSVISNTAINAQNVNRVGGTPVTHCTNKPSGTSIEFEQSDGRFIRFSCDSQYQSIASSSGTVTTYLIDNKSVKVDPSTCKFTCFQPNSNPYSKPIITVSFTVSNRKSAGFENQAASSTSASITMRNYNPR